MCESVELRSKRGKIYKILVKDFIISKQAELCYAFFSGDALPKRFLTQYNADTLGAVIGYSGVNANLMMAPALLANNDQGFCAATTDAGTCGSPMLVARGGASRIIGFWTHGDGKLKGKFEPVTPSFIGELGAQHRITQIGESDFIPSPTSQ